MSNKVQWTVWGGLVLTILIIGGAFLLTQLQPREESLPVYGEVGDFTLTNQLGEPVSRESLKGKIWVANIIFTSCPGPCAQMTEKMRELQAALPPGSPVQFVSLTTDPGTDTPEILKQYGERFGADAARWWFLTGGKEAIARLAVDGLKLTSIEKSPEERTSENDLFIHSTISVIIDSKGRLRGMVEALEPGAKEKALGMIQQLLEEQK